MPLSQTIDCTVVGLQGNPVAAGAPAQAGFVLTWNGTAWAPGGPMVANSTLNVQAALYANGGLQVTGPSNTGNITVSAGSTIAPATSNSGSVGTGVYPFQLVTAVTITQTSDPRMKKHIHDAGNALGTVCTIPVRTYRFKTESDDGPLHWGFLTTEVREVMGRQFAGVVSDGDPEHMESLTYSEMVAVLWKAVQELADMVKELQHTRIVRAASN